MDCNSLIPAAGDWKNQMKPEDRRRIINQIMDRLKKHLPTTVPEGFPELPKIAIHFEEEIYNDATSELDYVRSISLKLLEIKTQQTAPTNPNQNASDPASLLMQPRVSNQGQSLLMPHEASVGPGGCGVVNACDWKNQLLPEIRERIVYTIMDTLRRNLLTSVPEDLAELQKIAVCFEEKFFTAATSQSNYFRSISLKLRSMETKTRRTASINRFMSNSTGLNQNPSDPGQTGYAGVNSWQEEIYQKIKTMKDLYCNELNELYQKVVLKLQQADSLIPPIKHTETYERMKAYKTVLERMLHVLQLPKAKTQIALKDKLPEYEKQMIKILAIQKKKPTRTPAQQQLQHSALHAQSMPQQQSSQVSQHDNRTNQGQQMSLQAASMQSDGY